ncbi:TPA: hypothetical protein L9R81_000525 [Klebsiella pneumoniae]|nr:hypothetical protein [Klebsiella pneumoniae]
MNNPTTGESITRLITNTWQALDYSKQALAVLDMWTSSLTDEDEMESRRVAAVDTLLREAVAYLEKVKEVSA